MVFPPKVKVSVGVEIIKELMQKMFFIPSRTFEDKEKNIKSKM